MYKDVYLPVSLLHALHVCSLILENMKHYSAKPSAQLPKHMHRYYELVDNHLDIVPVWN